MRSPVNIVPRELLGIPVLSIAIGLSWLPPRIADAVTKPVARLMFGDLSPYGLERSRLGPFSQILGRARIPLVDVGTVKLIKEGRIRVHPGVDRFTQDEVVFTDGERRTVDAVVLATGYHPAVDGFLESAEEALNDEGTPITSGHEAPIPGLYFCGFFVSPTGTLRDISIEARRIARDIARTRGG